MASFCRHSHWCGDGGNSEGCATVELQKGRFKNRQTNYKQTLHIFQVVQYILFNNKKFINKKQTKLK